METPDTPRELPLGHLVTLAGQQASQAENLADAYWGAAWAYYDVAARLYGGIEARKVADKIYKNSPARRERAETAT